MYVSAKSNGRKLVHDLEKKLKLNETPKLNNGGPDQQVTNEPNNQWYAQQLMSGRTDKIMSLKYRLYTR